MITWFQRVFGKHFKWVLLAFLVVLFVSFIVSIGAVPRLSMQGNQSKSNNMFLGVDKSDGQTMKDLSFAVQYTYQNLYGLQISSQQELDRLVDYRIVTMHLADEWHIPEPTTQQLEDYLRSVRAFRDADGQFSVALYQKFRDAVETAPSQQRDAMTTLLKEECRLERVRNILGGPGYVLPFVAQSQIALSKIKTDLDVATLDYKSFTPKIDLTGDKLTATLQAIFAKDPTKFPRPAQVNIDFVKFPSAASGDPTAAQIKDYATQHITDFPGIKPDSLTDKEKTAVADSWRKDQCRIQTMKFARELYDLTAQAGSPQPKFDSPTFNALLKKYNLALQKLPTITVGTKVADDSPIPDEILQEAATALSPQTPTRPALLSDGTAVLFFVDSTPSRASTFEEARDDVLKVYTDSEKQTQFTQLCTAKRAAVVKDVAAGKTFDEAAKAEGFSVKNYPDVTLDDIVNTLQSMPFGDEDKSDTPLGPLAAMGRDTLTALYSSNNSTVPLIMALHTGEVSPVMGQGNTGVIFLVTKRSATDVAANSPEIKKADQDMASRESLIASDYMLDRLRQTFMQPVK